MAGAIDDVESGLRDAFDQIFSDVRDDLILTAPDYFGRHFD